MGDFYFFFFYFFYFLTYIFNSRIFFLRKERKKKTHIRAGTRTPNLSIQMARTLPRHYQDISHENETKLIYSTRVFSRVIGKLLTKHFLVRALTLRFGSVKNLFFHNFIHRFTPNNPRLYKQTMTAKISAKK